MKRRDLEEFPFRRWLKIGLGQLNLKPREFWTATLTEFFAACDGRAELYAPAPDPERDPPMTRKRLDELKAQYG